MPFAKASGCCSVVMKWIPPPPDAYRTYGRPGPSSSRPPVRHVEPSSSEIAKCGSRSTVRVNRYRRPAPSFPLGIAYTFEYDVVALSRNVAVASHDVASPGRTDTRQCDTTSVSWREYIAR